jgi:hypothetical protein
VADSRSGTVTTSGASVTYRVQRDGWSVKFSGALTDKEGGVCSYAILTLYVDDGPNVKTTTNIVCGKSSQFSGRFVPRMGTGFSKIQIKLCNNLHICNEKNESIPDHQKGFLTERQFVTMNYIFNLPLSVFLAERRSRPIPPFDWREDGCSAKVTMMGITISYPIYARLFRDACIRHDFGYKNYGKKFYNHTINQRYYIDFIFFRDMVDLCAINFPGIRNSAARNYCNSQALIFYLGVRNLGGKHFDGRRLVQ